MSTYFERNSYKQFLLFCAYLLVAAAAFNGFYSKWELRDGSPKMNAQSMLDGTANKPFVYRQLGPIIANGLDAALPDALRTKLTKTLSDPNRRSAIARDASSESLIPSLANRYYALYYLTFFALLASLYTIRRMCLLAGAPSAPATIAPALMALMFPFVLTEGGYYYDFFELMFLTGGVALALSPRFSVFGRLVCMCAWAALATANKESFFFFSFALYPLFRIHANRITAATLTGTTALVCGLVYLYFRMKYAANIGDSIDLQWANNAAFYVVPSNWWRMELTYGVLLPRAFSVFFILIFVSIAVVGWQKLSAPMRGHVKLAAAINLPLFLIGGAPGEVRNLSMLLPGLAALLAMALAVWYTPPISPLPRG